MLYEETLIEEASQVDSYSEQTREQREFQGVKAQRLRMAWSRVSTEEEEGMWGWPGVPSGKAQSHYSYVACYSFSSRSQQWAHAFKQSTVLSTAPEIVPTPFLITSEFRGTKFRVEGMMQVMKAHQQRYQAVLGNYGLNFSNSLLG